MKRLFSSILILVLLFSSTSFIPHQQERIIIPLGGNSWVRAKEKDASEKVTDTGWENWKDESAVWSTYMSISKPGILKLAVSLQVPSGKSQLKWTLNGISKIITVSGALEKEYTIGEWPISKPGYIKIDAQGINKTGPLFANVSSLAIEGSVTGGKVSFVKNNDGNYFYWGRRGPSVHINYDLSAINDDIEWFYNEITVPAGNDVVGSYFMADGFAEGYFGMQVNSPTERRVLFSVWSPFATDDPKKIPA
ncbi:MAG: DUF5077 domain-containing protein, partial [Bacteroidetes bacterium]|nr:DUF5077 domain-containing protein [Bacteroidota bacterium]